MRVSIKLATAAAAVATAFSFVGTTAPAMADPVPAGTLPGLSDIVGVGSDTTTFVMDQFSQTYNATKPTNKVYSWDATNPITGQTGDTITTKGSSSSDSTCTMVRPNGSSGGIKALGATVSDSGHPCIDYARSSRGANQSTDPHGLVWVAFAKDAVSWTTPSGGVAKPTTLTQTQLQGIYNCTITNWNQVGGGNAPIVPVLPQVNSGTRAFFLSAIGVTTINNCVVNGQINIPNDPANPVLLEENTGVSPSSAGGACSSANWAQCNTGNAYEFANNPNAIYPYSVADWIAQQAAPAGGGHGDIATFDPGVLNTPQSISGTSPIVVGTPDTINKSFSSTFTRIVWNVMPNAGTQGAPVIPANLLPAFGTTAQAPHGLCSDTKDIQSYGFETIGASCGDFFQATPKP